LQPREASVNGRPVPPAYNHEVSAILSASAEEYRSAIMLMGRSELPLPSFRQNILDTLDTQAYERQVSWFGELMDRKVTREELGGLNRFTKVGMSLLTRECGVDEVPQFYQPRSESWLRPGAREKGAEGIRVLMLYAGALGQLVGLLTAGLTIEQVYILELDGRIRAFTEHFQSVLCDNFPSQIKASAFQGALAWANDIQHDACNLTGDYLVSKLGRVDIVISPQHARVRPVEARSREWLIPALEQASTHW
jgi:hypothetical protein